MLPPAFLGLPAPEFENIKGWINSKPLLIKGLRGKVVMLDFWTYSCINCLRTLPHLKGLHRKYARSGLVLVGVHTPEFSFEKEAKNVAAAVRRLGIKYAIALDSDNTTWQRYGNRYWPLQYLIDTRGRIRYSHAGEGGYKETEQKIVELLLEAGKKVTQPKLKFEAAPFRALFSRVTPEIYLGSARSEGFGSSAVCTPEGCDHYIDPDMPGQHRPGVVYLSGDFEQKPEFLGHVGSKEAYLLLNYSADEVNIVLATTGKSYDVEVLLDEKPVPKPLAGYSIKYSRGKSLIRVDRPDMYQLIKSKRTESHEIKLLFTSPDVVIYTFTFR